MRRFLLYILIIAAVSGGAWYHGHHSQPAVPNYPEHHPLAPVATTTAPQVLPDHAFVELPFTSQAPDKNWDALHEDACEEASLIMLQHFLSGDKILNLDTQTAEQEIQNMVAFEKTIHLGPSITLNQLNQVAKDYLHLTGGKVLNNITIDDIKREIASGHPVIVGAAGKILPNPHFRNGGPNYHMLVIKGYDDQGFITNDPGTQFGRNFRYTYDRLFNAIHDWDPDNILNGGKNYLVFD